MAYSDSGVFYVAAGQKYVNEACNSAKSLKKINPSISISIACDRTPEDTSLFEQIIPVEEKVTCRNEGLLFKVKDYSLKLSTSTIALLTRKQFLQTPILTLSVIASPVLISSSTLMWH